MFNRWILKKMLTPSKETDKNLAIKKTLEGLGLALNEDNGHLHYSNEFKPLKLDFELVFVRHGETYGNCGQTTSDGKIDIDKVKQGTKDHTKRIYQGNVNTEINQLTELGKQQALKAAEKLENELLKDGWLPDIIFHSPLSRAKETGIPFVKRNHFEDRYFHLNAIREISFGSWDNRRICDMKDNDSCHHFYRNQNSLVKNSGINGNGIFQEAEHFSELILRALDTFQELNKKYSGKKILMFSHSMFGAACCILLGKGQKIENGNYLAFDGNKSNGESYTMPNATPFYLSELSTDPKHRFPNGSLSNFNITQMTFRLLTRTLRKMLRIMNRHI